MGGALPARAGIAALCIPRAHLRATRCSSTAYNRFRPHLAADGSKRIVFAGRDGRPIADNGSSANAVQAPRESPLNVDSELARVRREIGTLVKRRLTHRLSVAEQTRFDGLCRRERQLLTSLEGQD
jgi:hypothetical protein